MKKVKQNEVIETVVIELTTQETDLLNDLLQKYGAKGVLHYMKKELELERDNGSYNQGAIDRVVHQVVSEVQRARSLHPKFNSAHEAYAVILEELDEVWDEIKANNTSKAKVEMVQVAAMAFRFLLDIKA